MDIYLYLGNLPMDEPQYKKGRFIGLALNPTHDREIMHDIRNKFPFADESVSKIQSQDVFEHIEQRGLIPIFDEIYRILKKDGVFRLSVPDYNSPYYRKRCVYDQDGNILADLRMGGAVSYEKKLNLGK
jgi:SAM-dependent methyltransferase